MVFPQAIAAVHALFEAISLPVNLLVIVTIVVEIRFHEMRYILLASLAVSDFLFLILVSSICIASIARYTTKQRALSINLKSCPPSLLLLRGKEGMIHLLVETHVKKPDSGFLSDWSRNNTYESMCSDWPFNK